MCGFVGIINKDVKKFFSDTSIKEISDILKHRGPDSEGFYFSDDNYTAMVHRRLSILDISSKGNQPMLSASGRYVISFNGEIYNHKKLRNDKIFNKEKWIGSSDTETLIKYFEVYGIDKTLNDIEGMFSFVIHDKKLNKLYLARDRSGEKPLIYGKINDLFIFGSELSFLKLLPGIKLYLDKKSINQFFFYGYTKNTPFTEIKKIQPGSYKVVNIDKDGNFNFQPTKKYWKFSLKPNLISVPKSDIQNIFERKLGKVVQKQMISDVPLGGFLSSGKDSSLIISLMNKFSEKKLKTFTVGFENNMINEAKEAKDIAKYLGTDHHEVFLSDKDIAEKIPQIFEYFDFPLSDPSIVPTYLLSNIAKDHVKVALSGDGADELFLGYKRHIECNKISKRLKYTPNILKIFLNYLLLNSPDKLFNSLKLSKNKRLKVQNILDDSNFMNIYQNLLCKSYPEIILKKDKYYNDYKLNIEKEFSSLYEYMSEFDFQNYLPNDILFKLDICSMRNSLETRVPFLDKDILEFVRTTPIENKIDRSNNQKVIITNILKKYLPEKYINKKKLGFGLHLKILLKTSLLDWVESLFASLRQNDDEFLEYNTAIKYWKMFKKNEPISEHFIWNIISYLAWKKNWQNQVYLLKD